MSVMVPVQLDHCDLGLITKWGNGMVTLAPSCANLSMVEAAVFHNGGAQGRVDLQI